MKGGQHATYVASDKTAVALTPDERQVNILLASAVEVSEDVEYYHAQMNRARTERSYAKARQNFVECFERLANLLVLTDRQMDGRVNSKFRAAIAKELFILRQKAFDVCLAFLIERIRRIRKRTLTVLRGGYHPMGYAGCLEQGLKTVISALEIMGKLDNLPPPQQQLIEETRNAVIKLTLIEEKMGLWKKVFSVK